MGHFCCDHFILHLQQFGSFQPEHWWVGHIFGVFFGAHIRQCVQFQPRHKRMGSFTGEHFLSHIQLRGGLQPILVLGYNLQLIESPPMCLTILRAPSIQMMRNVHAPLANSTTGQAVNRARRIKTLTAERIHVSFYPHQHLHWHRQGHQSLQYCLCQPPRFDKIQF